ncbi:MAG: phosphate ABC transporter permease PstA [Acidimicrobiia bacterium]|nr:phosphate ABC transporter permease PstA [Acidimicrobiia bacterium]
MAPCSLGTLTGAVFLLALVVTVVGQGWDRLAADPIEFLGSYVSRFPDDAGIRAALVGTMWLAVLVAAITFPIGIGAALYLEELAPRSRITRWIETNIANLAGVPSIVYGLLGLGVFVRFLGMGPSLLAGALTLSIMSLPVVIVASREAIKTVPSGIREGALAVGATPMQVTARQVVPAALPGTVTGAVLALARAIGETAPLLVVGAAVSIFATPIGVNDRFSALPIVIFNWTSRPQAAFAEAAAAASIVLLALLAAIAALAMFVRARTSTRW